MGDTEKPIHVVVLATIWCALQVVSCVRDVRNDVHRELRRCEAALNAARDDREAFDAEVSRCHTNLEALR